jgi:hypothetical protein
LIHLELSPEDLDTMRTTRGSDGFIETRMRETHGELMDLQRALSQRAADEKALWQKRQEDKGQALAQMLGRTATEGMLSTTSLRSLAESTLSPVQKKRSKHHMTQPRTRSDGWLHARGIT